MQKLKKAQRAPKHIQKNSQNTYKAKSIKSEIWYRINNDI